MLALFLESLVQGMAGREKRMKVQILLSEKLTRHFCDCSVWLAKFFLVRKRHSCGTCESHVEALQ